jgi:uncharacterized damage-inducible protein DinB
MFTNLEDFINDWKEESKRTEQVLDALTDESLSQAVTDKDRTLGRIAWHIAATIPEMMAHTGLQFTSLDPAAPVPASASAIASAYRKASRELLELLQSQWTDDSLRVEDSMYGQKWPRGLTLRILIRHEIHHRAQMTVLMRQAGLKVPGIYGPSRDEWRAMGMTPPEI